MYMKWVVIISIILSGSLIWFIFQHLENLEENPENIPSHIPVGDKLLLNHGYREGHHLYSGEIKMPNSCYSINSRITMINAPKSIATIHLTSVDERLKYTVCSQISSGIPFDVLIDGPEDMAVQLFVDGKERTFTLNPVPWNDQIRSSLSPLNIGK